ncbi:MAG: hypothetical protein FJ098_14935, partial [Deltaproteobacteria bacterium]|nr:hypothetical protein [Deltaproteobacteria bacterium]
MFSKKELVDLGKLLLENSVDLSITLARSAERYGGKVLDTWNFLAELSPVKLPRVPEGWYRDSTPSSEPSGAVEERWIRPVEPPAPPAPKPAPKP